MNRLVREAVAERLRAVQGLASISTNRGRNLADPDLPAAVIGTASDDVELATKPPDPLERRVLSVTVVIVADGESETLDDDLDTLRERIEIVMAEDQDLGGLAKRLVHTGSELDMGSDEDGARWYGFLALSWLVEVWTKLGDPVTAR